MDYRKLWIAVVLAIAQIPISSAAWGSGATCLIEIEDFESATVFTVEHTFRESATDAIQRKHFPLPGKGRRCTLQWFNSEFGTSLSCELDELGQTFVQSDRTVIDEGTGKNSLRFRIGKAFFDIKSECKRS